jgi:hypothetical protein
MDAIPYETATQLCEQIRQENRKKLYTFNGMWCWGCATFTKEIGQRCFNNAQGCRGCSQVNGRFSSQMCVASEGAD